MSLDHSTDVEHSLAGSRQLQQFQWQLENIYDVSSGYPVSQFLVTDKRVTDLLENNEPGRDTDEKLLIAQDEEGVALTLFIDKALLQRLEDADAANAINSVHADSLNDYCVALEGVSHFVYFTFKASFDQPVSRLELELQAEVDKYVALVKEHLTQTSERVPRTLRNWLFSNPCFDPALSARELNRYRSANEMAARFCQYLETRYLDRRRVGDCWRQLRRFYRLSERKKLDWIRST